jgi:hypothetical protein
MKRTTSIGRVSSEEAAVVARENENILVALDFLPGDVGELHESIFSDFVAGADGKFHVDLHHVLSLIRGQLDTDVSAQGLKGENTDHKDET